MDAIRAAGAKQPIMLGGVDYASDLREWLANQPADKQVIASFHNYGGHLCHNERCWDDVIAPIAAEAPVVTGEFGETDCQTSPETFMDWADRHGVGYLMWAWWVLPDTDCSTLTVLADAKGTPHAPNGTALKAHLGGLAPRVSLAGPRAQALDRAVEVSVRCTRACFASATGRLVAAGQGFGLRTAARTLRSKGRQNARAEALHQGPQGGRQGAGTASPGVGADHRRGGRRDAQDGRGQAPPALALSHPRRATRHRVRPIDERSAQWTRATPDLRPTSCWGR